MQNLTEKPRKGLFDMITQSRLKELLTYDKETGIFHWKVKLNNNHDITKPAGVVYDGYVRIQVDGKNIERTD